MFARGLSGGRRRGKGEAFWVPTSLGLSFYWLRPHAETRAVGEVPLQRRAAADELADRRGVIRTEIALFSGGKTPKSTQGSGGLPLRKLLGIS